MTWHGVCNTIEESITRLLLGNLSMDAGRVSAMFADMDIVSLSSPGCDRGIGDRPIEIWTRSTGMAKPHESRDQHTWQEDPLVTEVLAELQAIEERMQSAVRFHTLMHQRCHLETPVQYERLFLHAPGGKEEHTHDHRRGTQKSHRRRVPHSRE